MNECGVYLQVRHRLWGDQPEDDEAGPLYVHTGGFPPSIPGPRQQLCQAERKLGREILFNVLCFITFDMFPYYFLTPYFNFMKLYKDSLQRDTYKSVRVRMKGKCSMITVILVLSTLQSPSATALFLTSTIFLTPVHMRMRNLLVLGKNSFLPLHLTKLSI